MTTVWIRCVDALAFATTITTPSTPSITARAGDTPNGIIVTAITTAGVILVALIANYRQRETAPSAPPPVPGMPQEDSKQNERIAVLEYQMQDVRERVDSVERTVRRQQDGNNPRTRGQRGSREEG